MPRGKRQLAVATQLQQFIEEPGAVYPLELLSWRIRAGRVSPRKRGIMIIVNEGDYCNVAKLQHIEVINNNSPIWHVEQPKPNLWIIERRPVKLTVVNGR